MNSLNCQVESESFFPSTLEKGIRERYAKESFRSARENRIARDLFRSFYLHPNCDSLGLVLLSVFVESTNESLISEIGFDVLSIAIFRIETSLEKFTLEGVREWLNSEFEDVEVFSLSLFGNSLRHQSHR